MKKSFLLVLLFLLIGCATNKNQMKITYYSEPDGAVLYYGQQVMGYTPFTLYYNITPEMRKLGHFLTKETSVRWASGATASIQYLTPYINQGLYQQYTFIRPSNIPGREVDMSFALELERNRILKEQIRKQETDKFIKNFNEGLQKAIAPTPTYTPAYTPVYKPPKHINCTSSNYGGDITYTDCYEY